MKTMTVMAKTMMNAIIMFSSATAKSLDDDNAAADDGDY